jgi:starch synthase
LSASAEPKQERAGRPRVLLLAEAANPAWTSVPLVGWCHARALSHHAEVHLVTHVRNRANIGEAGLVEGRDFTVIPAAPLARPLWQVVRRLRGGENHAWTMMTAYESLLYYVFEQRVFRAFSGALRSGAYDLVHRLTPLTPTAQSPLARWCRELNVPFVLGPLNGGLPWPREFVSEMHRQRDWLTYVRGVIRLMPGYRATRLHAAAIIAGSRATFEQLPAWTRAKTVYVPENGVDPERFNQPRLRSPSAPLRVAFVGRLVPYKGADMLLEAAAPLVRDGRVVVDVIGEGPELERLRALAPPGEGVRFAGFVPHHSLQQRLAESDVLGFPSVREFGGAVVLEAMALGLVPVVVDYGGPGEYVSPATGIATPMAPRPQLVAHLRQALERLAADPETVRAMGERARRRALDLYTWDAKARQVLEVWRWVLGQRDKPDFGMPLSDL